MPNKWKSWLIFGVIILSLSACKIIQAPEYKGIVNPKFSILSLNKARLSFDVIVFNPNKRKISLVRSKLRVHLDELDMGVVTIDSVITLLPQMETKIPLSLNTDLGGLFNGLLANYSNLLKGKKAIPIHLKGSVTGKFGVLKLPVPIKHTEYIKL